MHSSSLLFLSNLFSSDMLIIIFVALLLFGGEKLPEIARGLGKGIRDFKDASEGVKREINEQINNFDKKAEDKKTEEAIAAAQLAAQNPTPAVVTTEASTEDKTSAASKIRPVENTIPIRENNYTEATHHEAENNETAHTGVVAENHNDVPHVSNGTPAT